MVMSAATLRWKVRSCPADHPQPTSGNGRHAPHGATGRAGIADLPVVVLALQGVDGLGDAVLLRELRVLDANVDIGAQSIANELGSLLRDSRHCR